MNLVILTWTNTLPNDCFNSIIYVLQAFHKLEINSFSSSSFSCTFMWGSIWSLIWTFLWKSTNQRCFNCLFLGRQFSFHKNLLQHYCQCSNYSLLSTKIQVNWDDDRLPVLLYQHLILYVPLFCLLLVGNHREFFSTGLSTETNAYRTNLWIHTRILEKDFLVTKPWKDVKCNYEFLLQLYLRLW